MPSPNTQRGAGVVASALDRVVDYLSLCPADRTLIDAAAEVMSNAFAPHTNF